MTFRPPREGLVRAQLGTCEIREADDAKPLYSGYMVPLNEWTEINSGFEGHFMESWAEGSLTKTFQERSPQVTFNHGHDVLGDQVLGTPQLLREDGYFEVEMFDGVPPLLKDGLRANRYGVSTKFRVMREDINEHPERSDHNPKGIPERTVKEAAVYEFGPVTYPAYAGASGSLRSMTDEYIAERIGADKLRELIAERDDKPTEVTQDVEVLNDGTSDGTNQERTAPSEDDADTVTSSDERRDAAPTPSATTEKEHTVNPNASLDELRGRREDIVDEQGRIDAEAGTGILGDAQKKQWDELKAERAEIDSQIAAKEERLAELEDARTATPSEHSRTAESGVNVINRKSDDDIYDLHGVDGFSPQGVRELRERAMRSIERAPFMEYRKGSVNKEDLQENVERLVQGDRDGVISRRILMTGAPGYEDAFWKKLSGRGTTRHEDTLLERALGVATTGYAMPYTLDPTVLLTSDGSVNPLRQIAKVVQIAGQTWNGVNSAGVSASFDAEASEVSDDTPTLTQSTISTLKAQAFVPYSIESEQWSGIRDEMANEIVDAKDQLEALRFTLGTGTPLPQGYTVGATNLATTAASATVALADIDALMDCLPERFQPNAVLVANRAFYSKVRQLARTAGVNDEWPNVAPGKPGVINGVPAYRNSNTVGTVTTTNSLIAAYGDFSKAFVIVDSIGLNIEYVPTLFHTTSNRPSGQRGLHAYWMTNSAVRSVAPIRQLKIL